jgi:hypothetical protein
MITGPRVYYSWNITKQNEMEKIMQWPYIKSPTFSYGSGWVKKTKNNYEIITKNDFWNRISFKSFKLLKWF